MARKAGGGIIGWIKNAIGAKVKALGDIWSDDTTGLIGKIIKSKNEIDFL